MSDYILFVGEEIVGNSTNMESLIPNFKTQEKLYKISRRPSQEPSIWKLVKKPKLKF
jgi:hypothetical protein